jgi:hypothetical protein
MKLALLLVIIIGVVALAGTISAAKKVDEDYGKSKINCRSGMVYCSETINKANTKVFVLF